MTIAPSPKCSSNLSVYNSSVDTSRGYNSRCVRNQFEITHPRVILSSGIMIALGNHDQAATSIPQQMGGLIVSLHRVSLVLFHPLSISQCLPHDFTLTTHCLLPWCMQPFPSLNLNPMSWLAFRTRIGVTTRRYARLFREIFFHHLVNDIGDFRKMPNAHFVLRKWTFLISTSNRASAAIR